jgi:DNA-directed RNA polymerase subunit RPC12/RpoP
MSSKKAYIVFRCPSCGFYSLASPKQRTRLCVRCGKTVTLEDSYARRVESFKESQRLVGELNSRRDSETLDKTGRLQTMSTKNSMAPDHAKTAGKGLLRTFREVTLRHINKQVDLSELLRECEINGIPRDYAQKLIKELVDSGQAYRPSEDRIIFL